MCPLSVADSVDESMRGVTANTTHKRMSPLAGCRVGIGRCWLSLPRCHSSLVVGGDSGDTTEATNEATLRCLYIHTYLHLYGNTNSITNVQALFVSSVPGSNCCVLTPAHSGLLFNSVGGTPACRWVFVGRTRCGLHGHGIASRRYVVEVEYRNDGNGGGQRSGCRRHGKLV